MWERSLEKADREIRRSELRIQLSKRKIKEVDDLAFATLKALERSKRLLQDETSGFKNK